MTASTTELDIELVKRYSCTKPKQYPEQLKRCAELAAELRQCRTDRIFYASLFFVFLLFQACMMVTHYSGYQKPPMYGDFEAQRHWMELTVNLPIAQWYSYDLEYWGLDYPPLTAYHSWLLGKTSQFFNINWTRLEESRGIEQIEHKLFMRLSVIATMMTMYAPILVWLFMQERKNREQSDKIFLTLTFALLYPGLLFVDCVHFQYNHCSLAFFLFAVLAFDREHFAAGSAFFVLALNHKQMELYHALPIAVFLFARSIRKQPNSTIFQSFLNLLRLVLVVFASFVLLWLPFLLPNPNVAAQVFKRLFPVDRGLFEDKVANFWCCASVLIKFKQLYSTSVLVKFSITLVLLSSVPTLFCLLCRPNRVNFRISLVICAINFFLFSFQVHEKSILLAAIPALLLLNDDKLARPTGLFLSISCFSLYPLALKDEVPEILPMFIAYHLTFSWLATQQWIPSKGWENKLLPYLEWTSLAVALVLCLLPIVVHPPIRYPDLFPLLNAIFCFASFFTYLFWLNCSLLSRNWTVWFEQQQQVLQKRKKQQ